MTTRLLSSLARSAAIPSAGIFGALALCILFSAPARAQQRAEMLLSWNAPYGQNGALESMTRDCGDDGGADTLYVCYRLSRDEPVFSGLTALLLFHPQFDDTLGAPWKTSEQKPAFIKVEFPRDSTEAFRAGWSGSGVGDWRYYFDAGQAVIRMIYAVPSMSAAPIRGNEVYSLARIIIERPAGKACEQALCVEWMESKIAFSVNAVDVAAEQVRSSFSPVNSPGGLACAKYRNLAEQRAEQSRLKREAKIREMLDAQKAAPPDSTHRH